MKKVLFFFGFGLILVMQGCIFPQDKSPGPTPTPIPTNHPPVVNAGPDRNIYLNTANLLSWGQSYDPEGEPLTYSWEVLQVPADSQVTVNSLYICPNKVLGMILPDKPGKYRLRLSASDGKATSTDELLLTAVSNSLASYISLSPPGSTTVGQTLQAKINFYYNPSIVSYLWSFAIKPAASALTDSDIQGRDTDSASFIPDAPGIYKLTVVIDDGTATVSPFVEIFVLAAGEGGADIELTFGLYGEKCLNGKVRA